MFKRVLLITVLAISTGIPVRSQERFSFFSPSSSESVERMLTVARLRDDDVVVDLGSGDGVIPLTAARMNSRLRGRGVEIDSNLVAQSNQRAKTEGVADRVRFEHVNAFDVDLRDATVVTMWLYPEFMRLLRPIILERAAPGTRVVTSTWDLGTWQADEVGQTDDGTVVNLWIVPARVAGNWEWELSVAGRPFRYSSVVEQQFQKVEGVARSGDRREILEGMSLRGADISFALSITLDQVGLTRHEFSGKVEGDQIVGTVKVSPADQSPVTLPWRARRSERSDYFATTGTAMFEQAGTGSVTAWWTFTTSRCRSDHDILESRKGVVHELRGRIRAGNPEEAPQGLPTDGGAGKENLDEARRCRLQGVRGRGSRSEMGTPFTRVMKLRRGETAIFAYIVFKSRAHRDRVNAKVMKEMADMGPPKDMPFDMKRMAYGGFKTIVE